MKAVARIAAELQDYDPHALRADAVAPFLAQLVPVITEAEDVAVTDALDRILAGDLPSPLDVPPHDNSAMDGYAFNGTQLRDQAALTLRVVGTALAGKAWTGGLAPGTCLRIMTGAVLPAGLDTVVPQELVQVDGEHIHIPAGALRIGDNRRLRGEDVRAGAVALRAGSRLGPAALGLAASLGIAQLRVRRRLRVAYFSTGDEILSLGEAPREGAVYDSNRYTVFGLLRRLGIDIVDYGVIGDEPGRLEATFREAAARADAIITTGGVSVGEADHTKTLMRRLGDVVFWRIAMRPGKPMAVGRIDATGHSCVLFGLPGNPVAVMVTFLAFVRPTLLHMMGCTDAPAPLLRARSLDALRKKPGRTEYQRGIVTSDASGDLVVRLTGNQGSGVLSSMVQANGLVVLPHDQADVAAGDTVDVMMFDGWI